MVKRSATAPGFPRGEAVSPNGLADKGWRARKQRINSVEWYQPKLPQNLPLGEGAPACRGERGRRDAIINSNIAGEMVCCANSPQNVRKIAACCCPLQSCFARQLISIGIIATGNDCYLSFAARSTTPREAFAGHITFCHSTHRFCHHPWVGHR